MSKEYRTRRFIRADIPIEQLDDVGKMRLAAQEELNAASTYEKIAQTAKDEKVKETAQDVADEEMVHFGEDTQRMFDVDKHAEKLFEEGREEAKEIRERRPIKKSYKSAEVKADEYNQLITDLIKNSTTDQLNPTVRKYLLEYIEQNKGHQIDWFAPSDRGGAQEVDHQVYDSRSNILYPEDISDVLARLDEDEVRELLRFFNNIKAKVKNDAAKQKQTKTDVNKVKKAKADIIKVIMADSNVEPMFRKFLLDYMYDHNTLDDLKELVQRYANGEFPESGSPILTKIEQIVNGLVDENVKSVKPEENIENSDLAGVLDLVTNSLGTVVAGFGGSNPIIKEGALPEISIPSNIDPTQIPALVYLNEKEGDEAPEAPTDDYEVYEDELPGMVEDTLQKESTDGKKVDFFDLAKKMSHVDDKSEKSVDIALKSAVWRINHTLRRVINKGVMRAVEKEDLEDFILKYVADNDIDEQTYSLKDITLTPLLIDRAAQQLYRTLLKKIPKSMGGRRILTAEEALKSFDMLSGKLSPELRLLFGEGARGKDTDTGLWNRMNLVNYISRLADESWNSVFAQAKANPKALLDTVSSIIMTTGNGETIIPPEDLDKDPKRTERIIEIVLNSLKDTGSPIANKIIFKDEGQLSEQGLAFKRTLDDYMKVYGKLRKFANLINTYDPGSGKLIDYIHRDGGSNDRLDLERLKGRKLSPDEIRLLGLHGRKRYSEEKLSLDEAMYRDSFGGTGENVAKVLDTSEGTPIFYTDLGGGVHNKWKYLPKGGKVNGYINNLTKKGKPTETYSDPDKFGIQYVYDMIMGDVVPKEGADIYGRDVVGRNNMIYVKPSNMQLDTDGVDNIATLRDVGVTTYNQLYKFMDDWEAYYTCIFGESGGRYSPPSRNLSASEKRLMRSALDELSNMDWFRNANLIVNMEDLTVKGRMKATMKSKIVAAVHSYIITNGLRMDALDNLRHFGDPRSVYYKEHPYISRSNKYYGKVSEGCHFADFKEDLKQMLLENPALGGSELLPMEESESEFIRRVQADTSTYVLNKYLRIYVKARKMLELKDELKEHAAEAAAPLYDTIKDLRTALLGLAGGRATYVTIPAYIANKFVIGSDGDIKTGLLPTILDHHGVQYSIVPEDKGNIKLVMALGQNSAMTRNVANETIHALVTQALPPEDQMLMQMFDAKDHLEKEANSDLIVKQYWSPDDVPMSQNEVDKAKRFIEVTNDLRKRYIAVFESVKNNTISKDLYELNPKLFDQFKLAPGGKVKRSINTMIAGAFIQPLEGRNLTNILGGYTTLEALHRDLVLRDKLINRYENGSLNSAYATGELNSIMYKVKKSDLNLRIKSLFDNDADFSDIEGLYDEVGHKTAEDARDIYFDNIAHTQGAVNTPEDKEKATGLLTMIDKILDSIGPNNIPEYLLGPMEDARVRLNDLVNKVEKVEGSVRNKYKDYTFIRKGPFKNYLLPYLEELSGKIDEVLGGASLDSLPEEDRAVAYREIFRDIQTGKGSLAIPNVWAEVSNFAKKKFPDTQLDTDQLEAIADRIMSTTSGLKKLFNNSFCNQHWRKAKLPLVVMAAQLYINEINELYGNYHGSGNPTLISMDEFMNAYEGQGSYDTTRLQSAYKRALSAIELTDEQIAKMIIQKEDKANPDKGELDTQQDFYEWGDLGGKIAGNLSPWKAAGVIIDSFMDGKIDGSLPKDYRDDPNHEYYINIADPTDTHISGAQSSVLQKEVDFDVDYAADVITGPKNNEADKIDKLNQGYVPVSLFEKVLKKAGKGAVKWMVNRPDSSGAYVRKEQPRNTPEWQEWAYNVNKWIAPFIDEGEEDEPVSLLKADIERLADIQSKVDIKVDEIAEVKRALKKKTTPKDIKNSLYIVDTEDGPVIKKYKELTGDEKSTKKRKGTAIRATDYLEPAQYLKIRGHPVGVIRDYFEDQSLFPDEPTEGESVVDGEEPKFKKTGRTLYLVGYGARIYHDNPDAFERMLKRNNITHLVDIRSNRSSKNTPEHYKEAALSKRYNGKSGIVYDPKIGMNVVPSSSVRNRYYSERGDGRDKDLQSKAWDNYVKGFNTDMMVTDGAGKALPFKDSYISKFADRLFTKYPSTEELPSNIALMCSEKDGRFCHRGIVAKYLFDNGLVDRVIDLGNKENNLIRTNFLKEDIQPESENMDEQPIVTGPMKKSDDSKKSAIHTKAVPGGPSPQVTTQMPADENEVADFSEYKMNKKPVQGSKRSDIDSAIFGRQKR